MISLFDRVENIVGGSMYHNTNNRFFNHSFKRELELDSAYKESLILKTLG